MVSLKCYSNTNWQDQESAKWLERIEGVVHNEPDVMDTLESESALLAQFESNREFDSSFFLVSLLR